MRNSLGFFSKNRPGAGNSGYLLLIRLSWLAMQIHWPFFFIHVSVKRP
jgi:hypothetical protein